MSATESYDWEMELNHSLRHYLDRPAAGGLDARERQQNGVCVDAQAKTTALREVCGFTNNNIVRCGTDTKTKKIFVVTKQSESVMREFAEYVRQQMVVSGGGGSGGEVFVYVYCITFPMPGTVAHPLSLLSPHAREKLLSNLQPSLHIREKYLNPAFAALDIEPRKYYVLHIRSGDKYLIHNKETVKPDYIKTLQREFHQVFTKYAYLQQQQDNEERIPSKFVMLADNVIVKQFMLRTFSFLKTELKPVTHLGEGVKIQDTHLANTVVDMSILSSSLGIFSFSNYTHGSGFSEWIAKLHGIPYSCKYLGGDQ